jgi:hypothetical protein
MMKLNLKAFTVASGLALGGRIDVFNNLDYNL